MPRPRSRAPAIVASGLAVSARAEERFTRDVDLAIATSDDADASRAISLRD